MISQAYCFNKRIVQSNIALRNINGKLKWNKAKEYNTCFFVHSNVVDVVGNVLIQFFLLVLH